MRARPPVFTRSSVALAAAALVGSLTATPASAANCIWNAAAGNWNALANWLTCVAGNGNPAQTPGSNDSATIGAFGVVTVNTAQNILNLNNGGIINIDAASLSLVGGGVTNNAGGVINIANGAALNQLGHTISGGTINTAGTGALVVSGSSANFLDMVTLGGRMDMASAFALQRVTGGLTLNGATINLANASVLSFEGSSTLAGTGSIVFGGVGGANNRLHLDGNGTTTFAAGTTVRGENGNIGGQINIGGTQVLVNNGTISADVAGGIITIDQSAVTNNGTLSALNGGTLVLSSNVSGGVGSQIIAGVGSTVLQNGITISGTVNTSGSGQFRASGNGSNFLDGVTFNGVLDMASDFALQRVTAGGLVLNGTINVANQSVLSFEGNGGLSGNGTIVLGNVGGNNNRIYFDGNGTTTFAAGSTVRGHTGLIGGQLNIGGTQTLVNNGTISADVAGGTITINESAVTNNGTLSALNGGTLVLGSDVAGTATGQIVAGAGSTVLQNGVVISGIVNTSGNGNFRASASAANFLNGVTFNGVLDMTSAFSLQRVTAGGLVLNGSVNVGNQSVLSFDGNGGLSGNATIVLGTGANNRINFDGNGTTTFAAGTTVRGENGSIGGQLNIGGTQLLVNNGTISADVSGGTITIFESDVVNNGTLRALNGGTLVLSSNVAGSATGQIVAGAGSTVLQNGAVISGIVNTSGNGNFRVSASPANFLNGVTFSGVLDMASALSLQRVTAGGLVLNGSVNIGNQSVLSFEGNGGLSGNATIVLGTGANNRINFDGNGTTTFAAGTTVRGENGSIGGQLNIGGTQLLVNNGTISADVSGGTITIFESDVVNNGTLRALNGGTLVLSSNVAGSATGQIVAGAGSTVLQNGAVISGIVNTSGNGNFRVSASPANFLNGVTFSGVLDMASALSLQRVTAGGLVLNGSVNIGNQSVLSFEGNGGLSGNATIVLGTGANNRIYFDGNGTTTFAAGTTVRGENGSIGGQLLIGGTQLLVNNGTISADVAGGTITLFESDVTNNGTLSALNGGTLVLSSDVTGGAAGQIVSGAGSIVRQNGVRISGIINTSGSGLFQATANAGNFLTNATLNGNLDMASGFALERVSVGGLVLNGTINLANQSVLSFEGIGGLSGNGSIVLGSAGGANNRVFLDGNGTTTLAAGTTIRGHSGTIGGQVNIGGTQTLVNNGTINAELAGGTIGITESALVNNGLVRAQAGTLNVGVALSGTGTLQVDATGIMNLANGAKTQGTLTMGAAGAALSLGTGNLTLNTDYTNAGAGTGNSFNRRAGVTGAGLIVAGVNAAQAITGAGVSNGNTNNATLTLGNLRVGANTVNYQVANTGATGPTLRGAIQTNVNGANLTDARLSGSGVTPSLYSAGAPGANGGNLSVVFTAANAGALAPLVGQVLNLRSNFENIADQKLNIVLAGTAAAYNAAVGAATPTPVLLANQRVGGSGSVQLNVSNTAAAGAFSEDLRATFGANTGAATHNGGSISALLAGASNGGAMAVGVSTGTAGAKAGTVTLNYETTGTVNGVSNGLALAGANAPQVINVSGNVYQLAAGALQTPTLNFGTLQVGQTVSQSLVVRNTAIGAVGFVEDLNVAFGASGNGQITGIGVLSGIVAGANSSAANGAMSVSVTGAAAGALNSSIAVNYVSAGAVGGVGNGLGVFAVGSENYGVNGLIQAGANVINQASPLLNNPSINLGAVRVGAAAPSGFVSISNVATMAPQAALNASIAAANFPNPGPISASGSFNLLNPGATDNSSLQVALNTATAGNFTGANAGKATVSLVSDASNVGNCAPNCQLNLASQQVSVEGKVYTAAVGSSSTAGLNFGIVRVGDTVNARNIVVNNGAAVTALNDTLRANLSGIGGPFGGAGTVGGVGAGASGNIGVTLNTASNGVFSQNGSVSFLSQNPDLADISAGGDHAVLIQAQVNALAYAQINLRGGQGSLSLVGETFTLDFGTLTEGTLVTSLIDISNQVAGPADELNGAFNLGAAAGLLLGNWNAFTGLLAGADTDDMTLAFTASGLGLFERQIAFNGTSTNASDPTGLAVLRTLVIRANVAASGVGNVPEPGTMALVLAAAAAALLSRRRNVVRV